MQMGDDDIRNVVIAQPMLAEAGAEPIAFNIKCKPFYFIRSPFVTRARVDQNDPPCRPIDRQQRSHRHCDTVEVVRLGLLFPEHAGNHAEHGAAVQAEAAGLDGMDLVGSNFDHALNLSSPAFCGKSPLD